MKNYAYLSGKGILHIVKERKTAEEHRSRNCKIVETEYPAHGGYPYCSGDEIIVYSETDMRLAANGAPLATERYPDLAELYGSCKK